MLSKNQKPQLSFIEKITIRYKFSVAFLVGLIGFSISILYGNQFYISCTLFFAGIFSYLFMASYIRSSKQWADEFTATNSITESGKNVLTKRRSDT